MCPLGDEGSFNGPGLESRTSDRRIREIAGIWDIGLRTFLSSSRISDYWTSDLQYDIDFTSLPDSKIRKSITHINHELRSLKKKKGSNNSRETVRFMYENDYTSRT
jgi:hypothetical protein